MEETLEMRGGGPAWPDWVGLEHTNINTGVRYLQLH